MTVESMALRLGMPRREVLEMLERLRVSGCEIESHPQHGVAIVRDGLGCWADYLRWFFDSRADTHPAESSHATGTRIIEVYRQTTSTQDAARRIAESCGRAAEGAVAIADEQTVGRGRMGRRWVTPPGSAVVFSRVCVGDPAWLTVDRLMLTTAVAMAEAIEAFVKPATVQIKWPNDLCVGGRKVAGILVETFTSHNGARRGTAEPGGVAVIGVGINVDLDPKLLPSDPPGLCDRVASLSQLGRPVHRLLLLAEAIRRMDLALSCTDLGPTLEQWRRRCPLLSQHLKLRHGGATIEGQVIDLDPYAGLIVRTGSGTVVHLPAETTSIVV